MEIQKLKNLAVEITNNSAAKGFWHEGEKRSKGEMVMLMVSELGECLEAHRKGRFVSEGDNKLPPLTKLYIDSADITEVFRNLFVQWVKDSVEDELADVLIRVLDYINGWKLPLEERDYRKETAGNFGHDLLRINHYILCAFHDDPAKDWGYVIASIYAFCKWYGIDIDLHVKWKMRYNSTRQAMHGKAY